MKFRRQAAHTLFFLAMVIFCFPTESAVAQDDTAPAWGVSAMTLKPGYSVNPSADELLTNEANTISLNRFYRAGGTGLTSQSSECRVAYDTNDLFVIFRCAESDLSFAAKNHNANWYSLLDTPWDQDSDFPDSVSLFIRPDVNHSYYYQFAVTKEGSIFGCKRQLGSFSEDDDQESRVRVQKVADFTATVLSGTNEWTVLLRIPWSTIGGKATNDFGLLPIRTRWRNGEVSSPVAFDFTERPPMDLFIETHFSGGPGIQVYPDTLCRLPSGILRWQNPALLSYPDSETVRQIWHMEQSLNEPTTQDNLGRRLYLTRRWTDMMSLEGFDFRTGRGSIVKENMDLYAVRRQVNAALQKSDIQGACRALDVYLHELDGVSRRWFADDSPGDIGHWDTISGVNGMETRNNVLLLHCLAGGHPVDLHLSLPRSGGVRLYAGTEGFFKPEAVLPIKVPSSSNGCGIGIPSGTITIDTAPFAISFSDAVGRAVLRIEAADIAFRFTPDNRIKAVDFRNALSPNDVIYGFGERYDHFNENGHVLTLWGMDDWFGNTVGLMNETYKPIALFQNTRGYMIFDNSTYRLRADIGATEPDGYRLTQQGPIFDYYFWIGSPENAMVSYTDLTGKPILPPKWAFEPWMGRTGRGWSAPSHNAVAEEERVTERFSEMDIPHSAIYSEGPGADSSALNQFMAARDIKVLSWFWPVVSESDQATRLPDVPWGQMPILHCGDPKATRELGYVDFTNPNALKLMQAWWKHRLGIGVAGSMVDFGDRVPEDATFYDGRRGEEMHNFYAYDYHRTVAEVFREKRGSDFILFGRAAAPGDQRWVGQFAGDHPANFPGLQSVLTGALNLCACGFSIWGSDMGGFQGWPAPPTYIRWDEFACFSPLMRCHGRTPREPWNYGANAIVDYKYFAWVRENLLDYNYNAAADSHDTGIPIMRSMPVAYPDDLLAAHADAQYMFGRDLLVAPVVTENDQKTVRFPPGQWTSLWDGKTISGPTDFTTDVPLDTIPVYLKPGAIVPVDLNPELQFGQSLTAGSVKALIVTVPESSQTAKFDFAAAPISPAPASPTPGATVSVQPEINGFVVTLTQFDTDYLLVYGVNALASVKVKGAELSQIDGQKFSTMPTGWQPDARQNRVVIRLPSTLLNNLQAQIEIKL